MADPADVHVDDNAGCSYERYFDFVIFIAVKHVCLSVQHHQVMCGCFHYNEEWLTRPNSCKLYID